MEIHASVHLPNFRLVFGQLTPLRLRICDSALKRVSPSSLRCSLQSRSFAQSLFLPFLSSVSPWCNLFPTCLMQCPPLICEISTLVTHSQHLFFFCSSHLLCRSPLSPTNTHALKYHLYNPCSQPPPPLLRTFVLCFLFV